uniref:Uncharacterized protein n=1 Tax=Nelumbo nucifera TaxID=4432 RepID=A0A822Y5I2_NELNU|nr:TPA_asm: hypothetical protein HUJ06_029185 [Nelumbo nucifera]
MAQPLLVDGETGESRGRETTNVRRIERIESLCIPDHAFFGAAIVQNLGL